MVERAPNTAAFSTALPSSSGTLPPGCQMYWKSGCNVQPVARNYEALLEICYTMQLATGAPESMSKPCT